MKHLSLTFLLSLVLLAPTYAQRVSVSDEDKNGNFNALSTSNQTQEVRYILDVAYPDNIVLQLIPRADFTLNAHIVNAKGIEVQTIETSKVSGRYASSIDVSKLSAGSYFVEVQNNSGDGNNYRIPFSISTH